MENNNVIDNQNIKDSSNIEEIQEQTSLNETQPTQNLTNEQKLEYLSKLIQDAEQNLESNGISKKLIK